MVGRDKPQIPRENTAVQAKSVSAAGEFRLTPRQERPIPPKNARNRTITPQWRDGPWWERRAARVWQRRQRVEKFARMVAAHWDGIEAYCHEENKVPLGLVEGLNNKIRVIQRRAYGFRDEEYLRLKILTCT